MSKSRTYPGRFVLPSSYKEVYERVEGFRRSLQQSKEDENENGEADEPEE